MKNIFLKLLVPIILISATVLVIFYAKGYRINFTDNTVIKTGILDIETEPNRANYWLTEDFKGRSPKTITSIPEGNYVLDIWLDGYHGIKYDVEIFAEKSTPLSIFLFKENPEKEIIKEIEGEVLEIHVDKSRNNALILVEKSSNQTQKNYEILKYQANTRFWQFGANPSTLFSFSISTNSEIDEISISPNSKNILLTILNPEQEITSEQNNLLPSGKHLISLDTQTILASVEEFIEDFKWSHDGETIIWEDTKGINKLNLKEPNLPVLVYSPPKDTEVLYYDSYTNGEIYLLLKTQENSYVSLSRVSEELEKTFLVERIYYQNETRFLENWKDSDIISYQTFTNSPQSTLFVGEPKEFLISKENKTIIFQTEFAAYLYCIEENKYVLLNPYKTEFLSFSPDGKKVAFLSLENEKLGYYRFDKEINNYSTKLGGGYWANYINKEDCEDFAWHQNSQNFYYTCEGSLYAADIKTDVNINIIEEFGGRILLEGKNKIVTLVKEDEILNIIGFTIN